MTNLDFDRPGKGRVAKRRAFYIAPELEAQVCEHPITAQCVSGHGTWHTALVGALLRAYLAGDVIDLERHIDATLEESRRSHVRAQAKGQATMRADPSKRKRRHSKKVSAR